MKMLTIETRIDAIEIDGKDVEGLPEEENQLCVKAHWNVNRFVVLEFQGKSVTVSASQLLKAISNATNH
jgi:hypothetical protein